MKELVEVLPQIIMYIALGYSFIQTYKFVRILKQSKGIEKTLTGSLVVGFVLDSVFKLLPTTKNDYLDNVLMIICSIILGYLFGVFINSNIFEKICGRLHIRQTPNSSIWSDIEDKNCGIFVRLECYETKTVFQGLYVLREAHERYPIIQLSGYQKMVDENVEIDYTKKPNRTIVLDTSKFDEISVVYDTNSPKVKKW